MILTKDNISQQDFDCLIKYTEKNKIFNLTDDFGYDVWMRYEDVLKYTSAKEIK